MKKRLFKTIVMGAAIAVGATSLTGCLSMKSIGEYHAKSAHETLFIPLQQAEPHLAKHFLMTNPENGLLQAKKFDMSVMNREHFYPNSSGGAESRVHHRLIGADNTGVFVSSFIYSHLERERGQFTVKAYDVENDAVAQRYISMAKDRGNTVKSYSDTLAVRFTNVVPMKKNPQLRRAQRIGYGRLLVEFNDKGNVESYLVRRFERYLLLGEVSYFMYSVVQTGDMYMRMLENRFDKTYLEKRAINEL